MKDPLKPRDKITQHMTRDGLVRENQTTGEVQSVSGRDAEQMLVDTDMQLSGEVSQGTLDALAAQGYVLQDGQITKAEQEEVPPNA